VYGASRTRTGDLLGAITPGTYDLALVRLDQATWRVLSSVTLPQFGSSVGRTTRLHPCRGRYQRVGWEVLYELLAPRTDRTQCRYVTESDLWCCVMGV
jgi:hypothetical protein